MKLHLGCGRRFIPGYIHVDTQSFPHVTVQHAIERLPMFGDATADVIYACHCLEHFHRGMTVEVLREWGRILRPGGTLRLAVPDFEAIAAYYIGHIEKVDAGTGRMYEGPLPRVIGPLYGRQDNPFNIHYVVFDFWTLRSVLTDAGFTDVRRYDWQHTEHAGVDDFAASYLPHMDFTNGTLISLNVEATRP